jgi:acetyl esterase/lipase
MMMKLVPTLAPVAALLVSVAAPSYGGAEGRRVDDAKVIELWPEGVPGPIVAAAPEGIENGHIVRVSVPTLTVWRPAAGKANGAAAIVCPGGGYMVLAVEKEGVELQRWLNDLGVTVFLLKSRIAPQQHPAELRDVLRAVRLVRARAAELGVEPRRIGVVGASAGGHLAASAATLFDAPEGKTGAPLDAVSARPDFAVLLYPVITMSGPATHAGSRQALLGPHPAPALMERLSLERQVTRQTPPTFLVHTAEDASVPAENSILFYRALQTAGVAAELHLYEKGPHGFGIKPGLGTTSEWPKRAEEWLRAHGWLTQLAKDGAHP